MGVDAGAASTSTLYRWSHCIHVRHRRPICTNHLLCSASQSRSCDRYSLKPALRKPLSCTTYSLKETAPQTARTFCTTMCMTVIWFCASWVSDLRKLRGNINIYYTRFVLSHFILSGYRQSWLYTQRKRLTFKWFLWSTLLVFLRSVLAASWDLTEVSGREKVAIFRQTAANFRPSRLRVLSSLILPSNSSKMGNLYFLKKICRHQKNFPDMLYVRGPPRRHCSVLLIQWC